jgi:hypothetical protein
VSRIEVEPATMESDSPLEATFIAESACLILDPLDLSVEALGAGVGDPKAQVGAQEWGVLGRFLVASACRSWSSTHASVS